MGTLLTRFSRLTLVFIGALILSGIGNIVLLFGSVQTSSPSFSLLSPTVRTSQTTKKLIINVNDLRQTLSQQTASYSADLGLYFDYIPTSTTIGINQRESFSLASLLKIPVAIAVYDKIADKTLNLSDTITLTSDMLNTHYGTLWKKGAGTVLTVEEALQYLLKESDNTASEALMSRVSSEEMGRVFIEFDMPTLREEDRLVVTPKGYTSILRSLYFSTHLEPEHSEKILETMVGSITLDRKPLPIPETIPVAHKIGVHDLTHTYTDCGIVYYPLHPYVYCIMVKNRPEEEAVTFVRDIQQTMYEFIEQNANKN